MPERDGHAAACVGCRQREVAPESTNGSKIGFRGPPQGGVQPAS
jgi:hypothetical protein